MSIVAQFNKLSKDTFSYGLSSALQKLITMFLFPIYSRLLSPADFGIQDIILTTVFIITLFLILGLDSGVMLYYYESKDEDKTTLVSTYLLFEIGVSVPVVIIIWLFAPVLSDWIFNDKSLADYLRLGVASIPFSLIVGAILSTLRLTFQTRKFVVLTTFGVLLQITGAIVFVIVFKMGVKGILISILISNAVQSVLGFYLTYRNYRLIFSFNWLKKLLVVGVPLIPLALSMWIMNYSNRFFLVEYSDMESVGLLSIVNRVASIMLLFLSAFSSAWGPYAYSIAPDVELAKATYRKVLTYFILGSMIAAMMLSLFSKEIIILLATSAYKEGSSMVFLYSLSSICWVALYIVGMGTGIAKKNYHNTIAVIIGALLNTLFNYLLIPTYGVLGAAYASLIGNLIALIYMFYAGQYYFRVSYEFRKILIVIFITILAVIAGNLIDQQNVGWTAWIIIYKFVILLVVISLLIVFRIIDLQLVKLGIDAINNKIKGSS